MRDDEYSANHYLQRWLEAQSGLGLILFFWVMMGSLLGGFVMLTLGLMHWSPWWFLLGLMSLRLFIGCMQVGEETVERLFSGDL
ncbi:MAG: hypothetical protein OEZ16_13740 [Chromatiales bacterium]|nr:hypothetical protein [Chromatiales bacterium]